MTDLSGIDPQPSAPARSSITYRGLLAAVILMAVLIAIALAVLVFGLVTRFGRGGHPAGGPSGAAEFVLPQGARIVSTDVAGERLVLRLHGPSGDEIDIVDTQSGHLVAKIRTAPPRK